MWWLESYCSSFDGVASPGQWCKTSCWSCLGQFSSLSQKSTAPQIPLFHSQPPQLIQSLRCTCCVCLQNMSPRPLGTMVQATSRTPDHHNRTLCALPTETSAPFPSSRNSQYGLQGSASVLLKISGEELVFASTSPTHCRSSVLRNTVKMSYCWDDHMLWCLHKWQIAVSFNCFPRAGPVMVWGLTAHRLP